jgi:hypothetical protein
MASLKWQKVMTLWNRTYARGPEELGLLYGGRIFF